MHVNIHKNQKVDLICKYSSLAINFNFIMEIRKLYKGKYLISPDGYIFIAFLIDTHIGHIPSHMDIWQYGVMAIFMQYGHIVSDMANMGVYQESNANVAIWSRRFID